MYLLTWVILHIHYTRGLMSSSVILFLGVKMKIEDKVIELIDYEEYLRLCELEETVETILPK